MQIDGTKPTILVVEDTESTRYAVVRQLRAEGYRALEAATATGALELLGLESIDLMVLDVKLPDMLGYDLAAKVKADPCTKSVPILCLSASYTDADARSIGLERGADAYLTHPVDRRVLVANIKALLRARASQMRVRRLLEQEESLRKQAEQLVRTLQDAGNRKDEFIAVLSHELRNPLAPIRNSLHVLRRSPDGSEKARHAEAIIERQIQHMVSLVDDLLDVSRIARGEIRLARQLVSLPALLQRAVEDHRAQFELAGIVLEAVLPEGELCVDGDSTRLLQMIGNLLHNAAKFTGRGGKTRISLERDPLGPNGPVARVRVHDTGIGMLPELIPTLFEPFAQAESPVSRSTGGLGLGLALVKGFAALHGGAVHARSDGPGKGSEFTIELPIASARVTMSCPPPTSRGALRPKRVLIIEDEPDAAESLRDLLELDGHAVEVAASGELGVAKAGMFRPDVVLCDIGLPGMDGYEVARRIRRSPSLAETLLVALSGHAGDKDIIMSEQMGFDLHLAKPATLEDLVAVLLRKDRRKPGSRST